ncbi:flagellar protein FlaG [Methylovorus sp. MP688]|jgi:flagellar protein FlaG|uniref:flagellar protein FlaG n=1 Tax=Methylovorus sp. (strain MP688) TaxID=887061 RepID=UPI0001EC44E8|nr:flagellar protein FlaG [Methylovorus sp. MP688]ADQ83958.1 flagellar protein FlaG protein [Methylovorus sp. MP688]
MSIANINAYTYGAGSSPQGLGGGRAAATVSAPAQTTAAQNDTNKSASDKDIAAAVKTLNSFISPVAQSVQFSMDQDSGKVVVKVVDTETNKVLRQIPNEEVLAISKTLDKLQGLVIKQTA